jgi:DNA-binding IclR family transcriptional regulator
VLTRAVRVLAAFTPEEPTLRVSEVARRAELHVATASRLIAELVEHGLLSRNADGQVCVGLRLWELAMRASPTLSLRETAMPVMERLHRAVGQHTQLGVLDGDEVLFVERLAADGAVINITRIAARLPLHASSSGLVLLAFGSPQLQQRVLDAPLLVFTPETISTPERLQAELAHVRRQGYACCPGHIHLDATGIAVPVRQGARGPVVAALSVIVPNGPDARTCVPLLAAGARDIADRLARETDTD